MNKPKHIVAVFVVSMFFCVAFVGVVLSMHQIDKQSLNTTTIYTATVADIKITGSDDNFWIEIYTDEYSNYFLISSNITKQIDVEKINNTMVGQKIFFRIDNKKVYQINKQQFVDILSLNTDSDIIFSLEDYNGYMRSCAQPARMAGAAAAMGFFVFGVLQLRKTTSTRGRFS